MSAPLIIAVPSKGRLQENTDQFLTRAGLTLAKQGGVRDYRGTISGLDYYTGFEFELHARGNGIEPLVAGGRYDGLMTQLGSATPIPAVGFSIWVESLTQEGREPAASGSAS